MLRNQTFLIGTLLVAFCATARAEYVLNGDMTGTPGLGAVPAPWQAFQNGVYSLPSTIAPGGFDDGGGSVAPNMPASPNGGTFLVLTANELMEMNYAQQPISGLVVGQSYTLSFYYANVGAIYPIPVDVEPGTIRVAIGNQQFETGLLFFPGAGQQTWYEASFDFVPEEPLPYLKIWVTNARFFGAVDGVSIVPEPSSVSLAAIAFCFAAAWGRKRRHKTTTRAPETPSQ